MSLTYTSVVDAPVAEVFAWHERPGAVARLTPPWLPVRVRQEAGSLADGRAVFALPLGCSWVAEHRGAVPGEEFTDALAPPLGQIVRWRHRHRFAPVGPSRTRLTDEVDTPVPGRLLEPGFAYRHRQLAADLAVHARAADRWGAQPLTVAVTGTHGLVAGALIPFLTTGGHRVVRLVRGRPQGPDERHWDPEHPAADLLTGVDAVVHLAGAPLLGRFTDRHLAAVRDSRVGPTRRLADLAARTPNGPRVFISASAIGYYGPDRGDEVLTETSAPGSGVLADLVHEWEEDTEAATAGGVRAVSIRTGLVLSPRGGILRPLYPAFAAGLGGRIADGQAWWAWISLDDLVDIYHRALFDPHLFGPVNAVAPNPVRNGEFTATLARVLRRPALVTVPAIAPRLLLGSRGADEFALASQRVSPARLQSLGHSFRHPRLETALAHQLGKLR